MLFYQLSLYCFHISQLDFFVQILDNTHRVSLSISIRMEWSVQQEKINEKVR